jgi:hypothetical protein
MVEELFVRFVELSLRRQIGSVRTLLRALEYL